MDKTVSNKFRWLILFTMVLVTAAASMIVSAPGIFTDHLIILRPGQSQQFNITELANYFPVFTCLAMLPGGLLLDRFGVLKIYIAGLVLIGIVDLFMPVFGTTYSGMLFLIALQALGTGPIMISSIPIAAKYFPKALQTAVIVVQSGSIIIGGILIHSPWGRLVPLLGLILSIVAAVLDRRHQAISDKNKFIGMDRIRHALSQHAIWVVLACLAIAAWLSSSIAGLLSGYLNAAAPIGLGFDTSFFRSLVHAIGFSFFGIIIGVILTETIFKGNIRPVVLTGFVIPAIFILLFKGSNPETSYWILWCYVLATFSTLAAVTPLLLGYIAKNYPVNITGTFGGLAMCIAGLMGMQSSKVDTGSLQIFGYPLSFGYSLSFKIMVGVAVLGIIFILFLGPEKERP